MLSYEILDGKKYTDDERRWGSCEQKKGNEVDYDMLKCRFTDMFGYP